MNAFHEDGDDAAAALRMVRETQRKTAIRMKAPGYYHPALGCLIAVMIGSMESGKPSILIGLSMLALAILVTQYQKKTGVWANGMTSGGRRSKLLMAVGLIAIFAILFVGQRLRFQHGIDGAMIGAGILAGLFATWLGHAWERAMLKDAGVR